MDLLHDHPESLLPLEDRLLRDLGWGTYRQIKTGAGFKLKNKNGPFSAVSEPNVAGKYSMESSCRDLHNALHCTAL